MARDDHLEAVLLGSLAFEGDEGPRVAGGDDARGDRRLDRGARAEQPERLRHRDAVLAEPLGDLLVGQSEFIDQSAQSARFLDRVEVGALQILDQAEHQLLIVCGRRADDRGQGGQSGEPRGSPPTLAGDELVAIGQAADEDRLQHTMEPDRFGKLAERLGVEPGADLLVRGTDLIDRDHLRHHRLAFARHRDQCIESAAESARAWLRHRSKSSFASARYASAPRHVGSYSSTDWPWLGASPSRTLRGISVSRTWWGCERRTDARTSHARVVRASNCVITIPAMASLGLRRERTS